MRVREYVIEETGSNVAVANEIFRQIGGKRFVVMTGAKYVTAIRGGLELRLPRAKDGINLVEIMYNKGADDYTMSFYRFQAPTLKREWKKTLKKQYKNIYADDLQRLFTDATGLDTHL